MRNSKIIILLISCLLLQSCYNKPDKKNVQNDKVKLIKEERTKDDIPESGTYIYSVDFAEWNGVTTENAVTVIIEKNKIKIINNGILSGTKGEIIDEGIIMKHKTGVWIIAHTQNDIKIDEIGGCSDGPIIIDFENKTVLFC